MVLVRCHTFDNDTVMVPAEKLIQRPSVYGLIRDGGRALLAQVGSTGRFVLPGGGIEKGEAIDDALIREVREETGIAVAVGEFVHFTTDFFYYGPLDEAYHGFLFYYRCRPLETALGPVVYAEDEDLAGPVWAEIESLTPESFQTQGDLIMDLLRRYA